MQIARVDDPKSGGSRGDWILPVMDYQGLKKKKKIRLRINFKERLGMQSLQNLYLLIREIGQV